LLFGTVIPAPYLGGFDPSLGRKQFLPEMSVKYQRSFWMGDAGERVNRGSIARNPNENSTVVAAWAGRNQKKEFCRIPVVIVIPKLNNLRRRTFPHLLGKGDRVILIVVGVQYGPTLERSGITVALKRRELSIGEEGGKRESLVGVTRSLSD